MLKANMAGLSHEDQRRILGRNAAEFYRIT
jgi:hypothetical protein